MGDAYELTLHGGSQDVGCGRLFRLIRYIIYLPMEFRWNRWNEEHIGKHGIEPAEAEEVVFSARSPYPLGQNDEKYLVWGPTADGRLLQVVFVIDDDGTVFVIHARPLTDAERRRFRRRK